ncbi:MAG: class II glutamine amidotransferase [Alphaproteobacteria bacterium]|nr:MAG: class II glutamine amidotransferase [Alphaproteobacteria bacterium]
MCRWLAYSGRPIPMDTLLFKPGNSLIRQSLSAQRSIVPTNGDGFGLGWYGDLPYPGLFRDTMPAWNDANLRSLAEQIRATAFFAHVRASTGTATTRLNCHPFRWGRWLFMHNGKIGCWPQVKRELEHRISEEFYPFREGTTDSEVLFYLLLGHGLATDPHGAFERAIGEVLEVMQRHRVTEPLRIACAATDGRRTIALRYSSDRQAPSLFFGRGCDIWVEEGEVHFDPGRGCVLILSEPLDQVSASWSEVAEASLLTVEAGQVSVAPFTPVGGHVALPEAVA